MDSNDDEIFVGPITLRERKWHLTKPNYIPNTNKRHTYAQYPETSECFSTSVNDSVISLNTSSENSDVNSVINDVTTITINDSSSDNDSMLSCKIASPEINMIKIEKDLIFENTINDEGNISNVQNINVSSHETEDKNIVQIEMLNCSQVILPLFTEHKRKFTTSDVTQTVNGEHICDCSDLNKPDECCQGYDQSFVNNSPLKETFDCHQDINQHIVDHSLFYEMNRNSISNDHSQSEETNVQQKMFDRSQSVAEHNNDVHHIQLEEAAKHYQGNEQSTLEYSQSEDWYQIHQVSGNKETEECMGNESVNSIRSSFHTDENESNFYTSNNLESSFSQEKLRSLRSLSPAYDSYETTGRENNNQHISTVQKTEVKNSTKKPRANKYNYIISSVGLYMNQKKPQSSKKMPPPSTTVPLRKPTPNPKLVKPTNYNHMISPLAMYIKAGPKAQLFQKVTPTPVKTNIPVPTSSEGSQVKNNPHVFDESLPKVIYKPAKHKICSKVDANIPNSVKKLFPQDINIIRHKRTGQTNGVDLSLALEKEDSSSLYESSVFGDGVSILSEKPAFIS